VNILTLLLYDVGITLDITRDFSFNSFLLFNQFSLFARFFHFYFLLLSIIFLSGPAF